jgi:hypothetical protein
MHNFTYTFHSTLSELIFISPARRSKFAEDPAPYGRLTRAPIHVTNIPHAYRKFQLVSVIPKV